MGFTILGIGTAVPPTTIDQITGLRVAESLCRPTEERATWLPGIYGQSGIRTRHMMMAGEVVQDMLGKTCHSQSIFLPTGEPGDPGPTTAERMLYYVEHASPLATEAAQKAIENSGIAPRDLTHLVTVSCTGFHAPGVDIDLVAALGLRATIERTHIGFMGCHGALNGLRAARAFAEADPKARVLLCATELCSVHYYYRWDPQKMIANALFADGAAAVVGGALPQRKDHWQMTASGSRLFPGTTDAMTWSVTDHGFEMTLAKKVPGLIAEHLPAWLDSWLQSHGLTVSDIGSWPSIPGARASSARWKKRSVCRPGKPGLRMRCSRNMATCRHRRSSSSWTAWSARTPHVPASRWALGQV